MFNITSSNMINIFIRIKALKVLKESYTYETLAFVENSHLTIAITTRFNLSLILNSINTIEYNTYYIVV